MLCVSQGSCSVGMLVSHLGPLKQSRHPDMMEQQSGRSLDLRGLVREELPGQKDAQERETRLLFRPTVIWGLLAALVQLIPKQMH